MHPENYKDDVGGGGVCILVPEHKLAFAPFTPVLLLRIDPLPRQEEAWILSSSVQQPNHNVAGNKQGLSSQDVYYKVQSGGGSRMDEHVPQHMVQARTNMSENNNTHSTTTMPALSNLNADNNMTPKSPLAKSTISDEGGDDDSDDGAIDEPPITVRRNLPMEFGSHFFKRIIVGSAGRELEQLFHCQLSFIEHGTRHCVMARGQNSVHANACLLELENKFYEACCDLRESLVFHLALANRSKEHSHKLYGILRIVPFRKPDQTIADPQFMTKMAIRPVDLLVLQANSSRLQDIFSSTISIMEGNASYPKLLPHVLIASSTFQGVYECSEALRMAPYLLCPWH